MSDDNDDEGGSAVAKARSGLRDKLADAIAKGAGAAGSIADSEDDDAPAVAETDAPRDADLDADEARVLREQAERRGERQEDPPKPAGKSTDPRFQALHRKARRAKDALERERAQLAEERRKFDEDRSARSAREELEALRRDATEAPEKVAERLGISLDTLNKRKLEEGTPEARLDALERRLLDREKAAEERERRAKDAEDRARARSVVDDFVKAAGDDAKYPSLAGLERDDVATEGMRVAREMNQFLASKGARRTARDEEILAYMEARHAERIRKITAKRAPPPPAAAPPRLRTVRGPARSDEDDAPATPTSSDRTERLARGLAKMAQGQRRRA